MSSLGTRFWTKFMHNHFMLCSQLIWLFSALAKPESGLTLMTWVQAFLQFTKVRFTSFLSGHYSNYFEIWIHQTENRLIPPLCNAAKVQHNCEGDFKFKHLSIWKPKIYLSCWWFYMQIVTQICNIKRVCTCSPPKINLLPPAILGMLAELPQGLHVCHAPVTYPLSHTHFDFLLKCRAHLQCMILHRTALIFASMIAKGNCSNVFCQHDMLMNVCLVVCTKAYKRVTR